MIFIYKNIKTGKYLKYTYFDYSETKTLHMANVYSAECIPKYKRIEEFNYKINEYVAIPYDEEYNKINIRKIRKLKLDKLYSI